MYKIKFSDISGWSPQNIAKEIDLFFDNNFFYMPIFPYRGMAFDLSTFLDENCSSEMKGFFSENRWCQINGIIFCKDYIDIHTDELQCCLPFDDSDFIETIPK